MVDSVAPPTTARPAVVYDALGVVARWHAAQLDNFSARTIRAIGYNEVHERGIIDKNEAVCGDQSVEPSTGICAGIHSGGKSRRAEECEGDHEGGPLHNTHSRNPNPASAPTISISHISRQAAAHTGLRKSMSFHILVARTGPSRESYEPDLVLVHRERAIARPGMTQI